jgi:signal peptide peptidase SppA
MKYLHILLAFAAEPLAIEPAKLNEIVSFLLWKAEGGELSAGEIEARISQKRERQVASGPGVVGVINIHGMIMPRVASMRVSEAGTPLEETAQTFRAMLHDERFKAIVFNHDSPGGVVNGVEEFAQEIHEARGIKPIVAQINGLSASASYWLASAADEIVVTPSGSGGSIGVYTAHDDISKALEAKGIKRTFIASGSRKLDGSPLEPLSEDAFAHISKRVKHAHGMFVGAVARGRGVSRTHVNEEFGDGLVFDAEELVKRGMADRVGSMKDTLERFGVEVSPAMRSATVEMRRALAAGERVSQRLLGRHLREQGFANSAADRIASGGLRALDPRDAEEPLQATTEDAAAVSTLTLDGLADVLGGFKLPSFGKG